MIRGRLLSMKTEKKGGSVEKISMISSDNNSKYISVIGEVRDIKNSMVKKDIKRLKGGYLSYYKNYIHLASIQDILNMDLSNNIMSIIQNDLNSKVLGKLDSGKIYRALITEKYKENGIIKGSTPMKSIMITSSINSKLILERIQRELRRFEIEYDLDEYTSDCFIGWKEWLSKEEYAEGLSNKKVDEILTEVLEDEVKSRKKLKKNK